MGTVTLAEAQASLPNIIRSLAVGQELLILENDCPVAKLTQFVSKPIRKPRELGTARGTVLYMSPDFDAPLEG